MELRTQELMTNLALIQQAITETKNTGHCRSDKLVSSYFTSSPNRQRPKQVDLDLQELEKQLSTYKPQPKQSSKNTQPKHSAVTDSVIQLSPQFSTQDLRAKVLLKFMKKEPEESPELLDMCSLDRNNYWLRQKARNIETLRKELAEKEVEGCTFNPSLIEKGRAKPAYVRSQHRPAVSYSQLFKERQALPQTSPKLARTRPETLVQPLSADCFPQDPLCFSYRGPLSPCPLSVKYKGGYNRSKFTKKK